MKITANSRLRSRLNSVVMLILIILLTVLLGWLSNRYQVQYDWTANGRHTLSEASQQVLAQMEGPVEITAYAREDGALRDAIKTIVARYQRVKPDVHLHFINPDAAPDEVRSLGVSVNGELVIRYQGRSEHVQSDSEEEFTNALQRLARGAERWIAFIEGHGERSPLGQANFDLGVWVQQINNRGYKTQPVNLANIQAIPENTQILVIAGPQVELLPGEVKLIEDFVDRGGNLLWLLDPPIHLQNLDGLATKLALDIKPGTIIDISGKLSGIDNPTIALVTESLYPPHPVTRDFSYTTFFPSAATIGTTDSTVWKYSPVIATGELAWLETTPLGGEVNYDEGVDQPGPLTIGTSLEREIEYTREETLVRKQQRILVMGDGDFLSNSYVNNSGNLDLGLRMINWLANDDDFISIPARVATDAQLELGTFAATIIAFGFLIIIPALLVATGMVIWWRRKKQ